MLGYATLCVMLCLFDVCRSVSPNNEQQQQQQNEHKRRSKHYTNRQKARKVRAY